MQFLHSTTQSLALWTLFYLVVAALVFWLSPKFLAWIQEEFELGNWVISKSSRAWLAALWIGFLIGAVIVSAIAVIVLCCSRFGESQRDDDGERTAEDFSEDDDALPGEESAES
jgi:hypothetical protein